MGTHVCGVRDCLNTSDADSLRQCRRQTQTITETRPRQILHKYTKKKKNTYEQIEPDKLILSEKGEKDFKSPY